MIDGSEKRNRRLAFELQNSHVCEKRSNISLCIMSCSISILLGKPNRLFHQNRSQDSTLISVLLSAVLSVPL